MDHAECITSGKASLDSHESFHGRGIDWTTLGDMTQRLALPRGIMPSKRSFEPRHWRGGWGNLTPFTI